MIRKMRHPLHVKPPARTGAALVALLSLCAVLVACVPFPLGSSASREIPEATRLTITPGKSTRADVLLALAEPDVRGNDDRYFQYSTSQSRGGVVLILVLPYLPLPVTSVSGETCACLVIVFDPDGTVAKMRGFQGETHAEGWTILEGTRTIGSCGTDAKLSKEIQDWLAEP
jgi:hypothetical protein